MGSMIAIGIASGPPVGGMIIGAFGWHWVFLVNVPIGLISLAFIARFVPTLPAYHTDQRFDVAGALIMFFTLGCYALAMTLGQDNGFGSPMVIALMGVALAGLVVFLIVEQRIDQPMIDFSLFRNFLFDLNLLMGLLVSSVLAGLFILPYYLELVKNYPTFVVGVLMMVDPLGMAVMAPISGALSDRFGSRITSILGLSVVLYRLHYPQHAESRHRPDRVHPAHGADWHRHGVVHVAQQLGDHGRCPARAAGDHFGAADADAAVGQFDRSAADGRALQRIRAGSCPHPHRRGRDQRPRPPQW